MAFCKRSESSPRIVALCLSLMSARLGFGKLTGACIRFTAFEPDMALFGKAW